MVDRSDQAASRCKIRSLRGGCGGSGRRYGGDRGGTGGGERAERERRAGAGCGRSAALGRGGGRSVGEFHRHRLTAALRDRAVEMLDGSLRLLALVVSHEPHTF